MAVLVDHSTDGSSVGAGKVGKSAQATHCREGETGYNVFLIGTMGDTLEVTNHVNGKSESCKQVAKTWRVAKLFASRGVAWLVDGLVKRT